MTEADKPMFVAALNELALLKPGAKLTESGYVAWWNALHRDWTLVDFQRACQRLQLECEFMPNPFHFEQLRQSQMLTAGEAWGLVRDAARSGGECPDHPRIRAAVRALGGMRAIGFTNTDQMQFLERRFAEHFQAIGDAQAAREVLTLPAPARELLKLVKR